ncbi:hypothetical protein [Corynebacterium alimapuense]|uniref:hypothetical protein n=1 Tax=Corynebacterium alimapuense TaxID=1576874 RepID=UPI000F7FEED5|nr:hypothetical protein [Corynebacterium alimapuense]
MSLTLAAKGLNKIRRAEQIKRTQSERYEERYQAHQATVTQTNERLQVFGATQARARDEVTLRMQGFLERHAKQVQANEHLILDGVDACGTRVIGRPRLDADIANWVRGIVTAVTIGGAAPRLAKEGAIKFGRASTGNRISNLHGAAAEKATLAFFGGGSIKSGGGGMKLGGHMLTIVMVSPVILIAGLTTLGQGIKNKTHAEKFQTEVDVEIAQLNLRDERMRGVQLRAAELDDILVRLISKATDSLDLLESEEFIMPDHAERLQTALILQRAVRDVAIAPVANEDSELDESTDALIFKYREPVTEAPND